MIYKILVGILVLIGLGLVVDSYFDPYFGLEPAVSATTTPATVVSTSTPNTFVLATTTSATSTPQMATTTQATSTSPAVAALHDAAIKSALADAIVNALLYEDSGSGSYGTDTLGDCSSAISESSAFSSPTVKNDLENIAQDGSAQQTCKIYGNGSSIAISAQLTATPSKWYCEDSSHPPVTTTGNSLLTSTAGCK